MIEIKTVSALEKILPRTDTVHIRTDGIKLSGERFAFQVSLRAINNPVVQCRLRCESELPVKIYREDYVPGLFISPDHDEYIINERETLFPDVLVPYTGECFSLAPGINCTFWVELPADDAVLSGVYEIRFSAADIRNEVDRAETVYRVRIVGGQLAQNDLLVTKWIHFDSIAETAHARPFTPKFYRVFREVVRLAVRSGQTMAYIPMFTPPLDTAVGKERLTVQSVEVRFQQGEYRFCFKKFDELIQICKEEGIRYFEMSHLFTQWGAASCPKIMVIGENGRTEKKFGWKTSSESEEYTVFLRAFLPALSEHLQLLGIRECTFLHLSDEPSAEHLMRYIRLHNLVKRCSGGMKTIDALSSYSFAENNIPDLPVVLEGEEEPFIQNGKNFALYYSCVTDKNNHSNIFLHMPLLRVRVLGVILYLQQAIGFLHWGLNFYRTALSYAGINPFCSTDGGGTLPAGDPFCIYPDGARGVFSSLRQETFACAIQDYCLLKKCESLYGRARVLQVLEKHGFSEPYKYPHDETAFESLRSELVSIITD